MREKDDDGQLSLFAGAALPRKASPARVAIALIVARRGPKTGLSEHPGSAGRGNRGMFCR